MKFSNFNSEAKRTHYRHGNLFEEGSYVQCGDKVGKVHRRGPNYVIAVTDDGDMFRAWAQDITEVNIANKYNGLGKGQGRNAKHRLVGTDRFRQFTRDMARGSDYDMWKEGNYIPKTDKDKGIEEMLNNKHRSTEETMYSNWRSELSEKTSKFVEVSPQIKDNTDPMDQVFDKNKKLKGANKAVKEEVLDEKMATKDHDGDGKIESGKDEYFGSRDKAIKKAIAKRKGLKKEHHQKDEDGNVVEHGDGTPSNVEEGKKRGLWDNIHAKRKRGEKPAKKGDKDYPKTLNVEGLKQARKNVGASTCWDGYKAKGTKKKGGKEVPNCVKEEEKVDTGHVHQKKKQKGMKYADGVNEQLRDHLDELRARYKERVEKMYEGYGKKKKKMGYK